MKKRKLDNLLEDITAGIRSEQIDESTVNEATDRVWARMNSEMLAIPDLTRQDAGAPNRIEGCADFQSLIPAYLDRRLSEARSLLLVDHTHECIPCRKALKSAREARLATPRRAANSAVRTRRPRSQQHSLRPVILRWGIAAVLI